VVGEQQQPGGDRPGREQSDRDEPQFERPDPHGGSLPAAPHTPVARRVSGPHRKYRAARDLRVIEAIPAQVDDPPVTAPAITGTGRQGSKA
jgi:hypothetical protein